MMKKVYFVHFCLKFYDPCTSIVKYDGNDLRTFQILTLYDIYSYVIALKWPKRWIL